MTDTSENLDALARTLDETYLHVVEHLDAEERRLLPIAARNLTQAEWERLGAEGRRRSPRRTGPLVLGMFRYEGEPEAFARMVSAVPAPVLLASTLMPLATNLRPRPGWGRTIGP